MKSASSRSEKLVSASRKSTSMKSKTGWARLKSGVVDAKLTPEHLEFAEPTAQGRRKQLALSVAGAIVGVLFILVARRLFEFINGLPACEQSRWLLGVFVAAFLPSPAVAFGTIAHAKKLLRFNQSPLPNALVLRRTRIRRGQSVRVEAYALIVISVCLLAGALYLIYMLLPVFSGLSQLCGA